MNPVMASSIIRSMKEENALEVRTVDGKTYVWKKPAMIFCSKHDPDGIVAFAFDFPGTTTYFAIEHVTVMNVIDDPKKTYGADIGAAALDRMHL